MRYLSLLFLLFVTAVFAYPSYSTAVKEKKIYPMGKKIYEHSCKTLNPKEYASYDALSKAISLTCKGLGKKYQEALGVYLWDSVHTHNGTAHLERLHVNESEKCPVCGMFLYKYPEWITKITYAGEKSYYFDGVKDMFKYYFSHKQGVKQILVQDYYTHKTLDATKAFFVSGSDVYGPMGRELIPFESLKAAKSFRLDHRGRDILRFETVTPRLIESLDASY